MIISLEGVEVTYPACDTNVTVTMSFGGTAWSINPEDMLIFQMPHSNDCVGGFFDLTAGSNVPAGSGNPSWVVGDTFLVRSCRSPWCNSRSQEIIRKMYILSLGLVQRL